MKQLPWLVAILLTACGGGDGGGDAQRFIGLYAATSHRFNDGNATTVPCGDAGAEVGEPAYVRLVEDEFFEDPNILTLRECDTTDEGTCTDVFDNFHGGGDGLLYENFNTQTGGGFTCQLYASRTEGTLTEDGILHLASRHWYEMSDDPDCPLDAAEALLDSPDCETVETWDAQTLTR